MIYMLELDRALDVDLDESSVVSIGKYNGRHLFVNNDFADAAFGIQLYASCCETVVAGNTMRRAGSHNAKGHFTRRHTVAKEPIRAC